jgi:hypothetical protein
MHKFSLPKITWAENIFESKENRKIGIKNPASLTPVERCRLHTKLHRAFVLFHLLPMAYIRDPPRGTDGSRATHAGTVASGRRSNWFCASGSSNSNSVLLAKFWKKSPNHPSNSLGIFYIAILARKIALLARHR